MSEDNDRPKPFMAKFEIPMPPGTTDEQIAAAAPTGPKTTNTPPVGNIPADTHLDGDWGWE